MRKETSSQKKSKQQDKKSTDFFWILVISLMFIFLGLWMLNDGIFEAQEKSKLAAESSNWLTTEGLINASEIVTEEVVFSDGHSYTRETWDLSYSYSVNEIDYQGTRYEFRTEDIEQGTVEQYWEGKEVSVYYNPEDPRIAVLVPGSSNFDPNSRFFTIGFGIFFLGIGFLLLVFFLGGWIIKFLRRTTELTN